jgi:uncharacterized protein (DUF302 family)
MDLSLKHINILTCEYIYNQILPNLNFMEDIRMKRIMSAVLLALIALATMAQAGTGSSKNQMVPVGEQNKMILEKVSPFGHDDTVKKISDAAKSLGWVVSGIKQLDKSIAKSGGPKVLPVTLVEICNAEHAGKILLDDSSRWASVMMPCTISVYDKSDGKTYVGFMNAPLIGTMFGGLVGEVMGGPVADGQSKILSFLK